MDEANLLNDQEQQLSYGSTEHLNDFHCHKNLDEIPSSNKRARNVLWLSLLTCLAFMIGEIVGGLIAQSLAIITDAAHLLTDFASILISLFSLYLATMPASQRMSFGWHRAEVLGAFISVFLIWIITGVLVYLAIDRIITNKYDINATVMAITATFGLLVNIIMTIMLYVGGHSHSHISERSPREMQSSTSHKKVNINVRAAMVHVIGDLIQSIGVLIAALIIFFNKEWSIVDPICTLLFSIIVLCTTIYIVRDALVVLLEGRPSNIDFRSVFASLENIEGVQKVHDLRIWSLTMDKIALSVHLEIIPGDDAQRILKATTLMLRERYGVHESTVQIEGYSQEDQNCDRCIPPA